MDKNKYNEKVYLKRDSEELDYFLSKSKEKQDKYNKEQEIHKSTNI